jgi:hypothetical protein
MSRKRRAGVRSAPVLAGGRRRLCGLKEWLTKRQALFSKDAGRGIRFRGILDGDLRMRKSLYVKRSRRSGTCRSSAST